MFMLEYTYYLVTKQWQKQEEHINHIKQKELLFTATEQEKQQLVEEES